MSFGANHITYVVQNPAGEYIKMANPARPGEMTETFHLEVPENLKAAADAYIKQKYPGRGKYPNMLLRLLVLNCACYHVS